MDVNKWLRHLNLYSGVTGVIVLWSFIGFAMNKARLGLIDNRPISYLGVNHDTKSLFMAGLIVSAVLFLSFGYYVKRKFKINNRFIIYLVIGQVAQIMVALFPDASGSPYKIVHTVAAFILAGSLPLLIGQFALFRVKDVRHKLYIRLLWFERFTFVVGIGLFVFTKGIAPLGEALPTVGFHLWIIVLTYIMFKSNKLVQLPQ